MTTYAIGDIQGCFNELQHLLEKIKFSPTTDELWFVGDLVNRGTQSLEVLRFIKSLPHKKVVLGNHDIHLLALAGGATHSHHTLHAILTAPDRDELIDWLRHQSILHYDANHNIVMTHAGIYPFWDFATAQTCAKQLEQAIKTLPLSKIYLELYGNQPNCWSEAHSAQQQLRFITNAFTRMRFCSPQGVLDLNSAEGLDKQPPGFMPWFKLPRLYPQNLTVIFGHWAALMGITNESNIMGIDTGCVWGNCLTAIRLEDWHRFSVSCAPLRA